MITEETTQGMDKVVGVAQEEAEKLQSRIVGSRWEEQDSGGYRLHLTLPGGIGLTVTLTRVQLDDQHNVRSSIHQAIERAIRHPHISEDLAYQGYVMEADPWALDEGGWTGRVWIRWANDLSRVNKYPLPGTYKTREEAILDARRYGKAIIDFEIPGKSPP